MLGGVPPESFYFSLLLSNQKLQMFLFELPDGAERRAPYQEKRIGVADAVRFEPGERPGAFNRRVFKRNLGVGAQAASEVLVTDGFRRVAVEAVASVLGL